MNTGPMATSRVLVPRPKIESPRVLRAVKRNRGEFSTGSSIESRVAMGRLLARTFRVLGEAKGDDRR